MENRLSIRNFRELNVWQLGKTIASEIYTITKGFPKEEIYGLVSQMRRASVSIPSNVAEGFNRFHPGEYRQFLFIALGSCAELETQMELSKDFGYVSGDKFGQILEKLNHESRMLRNLIKKKK